MSRSRSAPTGHDGELFDAALTEALVAPQLSADFEARFYTELAKRNARGRSRGTGNRARLHVPGGVYYVVQRSMGGQPIFTDAADYGFFERLLAIMLVRCRMRVHAFCWEVDAIHLVLQVTDLPIGKLIQRLSSQYARGVRRRQATGGRLFQRRHRSLLIDPDAYLLKLIRYLHLIPVRAGCVPDPTDYALSSQRAYMGMGHIPWLTTSVALRMLAQRPEQARYAYRRLMLETPARNEGTAFERGCDDDPRIMGDRHFIADIPRHMRVYRSSYSLDEVIDRVSCTLGVERCEVLSRSRQRRHSLARALITWYATESGVATLAEVSRRFERNPSTLFVGVERHRTLRPELFNLTALVDTAHLMKPLPDPDPMGAHLSTNDLAPKEANDTETKGAIAMSLSKLMITNRFRHRDN